MKSHRMSICCLLPVLLLSCSTDYGTLRPDLEVAKLFETCRVLPDHRYYYSGPESQPDAIIGIENAYTLQTTMWKPVVMTPELLKRWLNNMLPAIGISFANYGSAILDPSGKQVGVWYSYYDQTTIQFPGDQVIIIHKPPTRTDSNPKRFFYR